MISHLVAVQFKSGGITHYNFSDGNRQITKKSSGWNDIVFANFCFCESGRSEFSVRLRRHNPQYGLLIGAAIDSARTDSILNSVGWCLNAVNYQLRARGSVYHQGNRLLRDGQVVTVRVNEPRKQIVYLVDGVPAGPPHTMNINFADILLLRPAVQIVGQGDSLEIL